MAKQTGMSKHKRGHKSTKHGGQIKTSSMSKSEKRSHKKYRGQGK